VGPKKCSGPEHYFRPVMLRHTQQTEGESTMAFPKTFRAGHRADASLRDASQQGRLPALASKFSPKQLGGAFRAFVEHLFAAAGEGEDGRRSRLEVYGAQSDPNFPAEVMAALERRVGDADQGGPRLSPAQLEEEPDYTPEEFAAAVAARVAEAMAAYYGR